MILNLGYKSAAAIEISSDLRSASSAFEISTAEPGSLHSKTRRQRRQSPVIFEISHSGRLLLNETPSLRIRRKLVALDTVVVQISMQEVRWYDLPSLVLPGC